MQAPAAEAQVDTDEEERDAGDVREVQLELQQWRHLAHGRRSELAARRASGSKRSTNPKTRAIKPNNVPSMITAPTAQRLSDEECNPLDSDDYPMNSQPSGSTRGVKTRAAAFFRRQAG